MKFKATEMHAISEVQTTIHWWVSFQGPPFSGQDQSLHKRCTTIDLPKGTHARIDLMTHGYQFPTPGRVNRNGDITITFFEPVDALVVQMMHDWQSDMWEHIDMTDEMGFQTSHPEVFGQVTMDLLNKSNTPTQQYILHHCIIADIDQGGQLSDGSSPDYFKPVLNLGYAWFNFKSLGLTPQVAQF